jgi:hypothetical protein
MDIFMALIGVVGYLLYKNETKNIKITDPYSAAAMVTSPSELVATGKAFSPKIGKIELVDW